MANAGNTASRYLSEAFIATESPFEVRVTTEEPERSLAPRGESPWPLKRARELSGAKERRSGTLRADPKA